MHASKILATFVAMGVHVVAYNNNCEGSGAAGIALIPQNCINAKNAIDTSATYTDGTEFSKGNCYVKYATNGSGDQPISGQDIVNTMTTIMDSCDLRIGSFGTGNCDSCHVTINYRA
ncbi:uncharacterized protein N7518_001131 [Penicillium psychrosexuale]|uniref:uncharacterized protein n=1 Tax=Penicillium psychrosexuale TaxID=1002107 RepID=UPI0025454B4A|nr:uncharacterized protein N7518_001131 [Penicillium psychrosexuale]KAJ5799063.1 hypothetical protein N7518_001131 [Penicillium psychrosexuale]